MTRTYSPEELEDVRLTEMANASAKAKRGQTAEQAQEGQLKLYHPHLDALKFGRGDMLASGPETTDEMIVFGNLEPGVAIVRAGHPLLPALLRRHSGIKVMEPGEVPGRTYVCDHCDKEWTTKRSLANHRKADHPAPPETKKATAQA